MMMWRRHPLITFSFSPYLHGAVSRVLKFIGMPQLQWNVWFWRMTFDMGLIWPLKPKPVKKATMKVCWVSLFLAVIVLASTVNAGGIMGKGLSKSKQKWYPSQICGSITFLFNTHTVQVCVSCSWCCPGTSAPVHLSLAWHTWQFPWFSAAPEATHEASGGPLKGVVSPKKALQGFETETRELLGVTKDTWQVVMYIFTYLALLTFDFLHRAWILGCNYSTLHPSGTLWHPRPRIWSIRC